MLLKHGADLSAIVNLFTLFQENNCNKQNHLSFTLQWTPIYGILTQSEPERAEKNESQEPCALMMPWCEFSSHFKLSAFSFQTYNSTSYTSVHHILATCSSLITNPVLTEKVHSVNKTSCKLLLLNTSLPHYGFVNCKYFKKLNRQLHCLW